MINPESIILPNWPAPKGVKSVITTRFGGLSKAPYDTFNLGAHVGDEPRNVEGNRSQLYDYVGHSVDWLSQVHGNAICRLDEHCLTTPDSLAAVSETQHGAEDNVLEGNVLEGNVFEGNILDAKAPEADAAFTSQRGRVCAVMTADCLPILLCDVAGEHVAAVHAGWRSLAHGIVAKALACFPGPPERVIAYLGPAISQDCFEVGEDVREAFLAAEAARDFAEDVCASFRGSQDKPGMSQFGQNKYYADIYRLAKSELNGLGVRQIFGGDLCSYQDPRFYSYRRDGITGRMASLIWLDSE